MMSKRKKIPDKIKRINKSGKAQLRINDIRVLESYGLTPVPKHGKHRYEIRDREGNVVAGKGFTFGTEEVSEYVQRLKIEHPLHLPANAYGLYYPGLYERCEKLYFDAKQRGQSTNTKDLWEIFRTRYSEENRQRHQEYVNFVRCGLCYTRHRASMYSVVAWMLSIIRKKANNAKSEQTA